MPRVGEETLDQLVAEFRFVAGSALSYPFGEPNRWRPWGLRERTPWQLSYSEANACFGYRAQPRTRRRAVWDSVDLTIDHVAELLRREGLRPAQTAEREIRDFCRRVLPKEGARSSLILCSERGGDSHSLSVAVRLRDYAHVIDRAAFDQALTSLCRHAGGDAVERLSAARPALFGADAGRADALVLVRLLSDRRQVFDVRFELAASESGDPDQKTRDTSDQARVLLDQFARVLAGRGCDPADVDRRAVSCDGVLTYLLTAPNPRLRLL
ncbi:MAG: hypothetical protein KC609_08595 [Myxococcales bacterium]|nr:hypothetical protein [Myxococcales bacterium]